MNILYFKWTVSNQLHCVSLCVFLYLYVCSLEISFIPAGDSSLQLLLSIIELKHKYLLSTNFSEWLFIQSQMLETYFWNISVIIFNSIKFGIHFLLLCVNFRGFQACMARYIPGEYLTLLGTAGAHLDPHQL